MVPLSTYNCQISALYKASLLLIILFQRVTETWDYKVTSLSHAQFFSLLAFLCTTHLSRNNSSFLGQGLVPISVQGAVPDQPVWTGPCSSYICIKLTKSKVFCKGMMRVSPFLSKRMLLAHRTVPEGRWTKHDTSVAKQHLLVSGCSTRKHAIE